MSTYSCEEEKSNCVQSEVHSERVREHLHKPSFEETNIRNFQASSRNERNLSRAASESVQTTNNLCIRLQHCRNETSPESHVQLQFTSFYSVSFPSRWNKDNRIHNCTVQQLKSNNQFEKFYSRGVAEVQHPEFGEKAVLPISSSELTTKDEDSSKKDGVTHPLENHSGNDILEGIQHCLTVCDQTQPAKNCLLKTSAGSETQTEQGLNERNRVKRKPKLTDAVRQNVEEGLSKRNVISSREYPGSNAIPHHQVSAKSLRAVKRTLSSASFPAINNGGELDTDPDPTGRMITSTLVSVLAPHWSGHFRRNKRDLSDDKPVTQLGEQNRRLSASCQNIHQQSFLSTQIPTREERYNEFHSQLRGPARTSRNSVEWEKDSPQNLSSTLQLKRQFFKNSSLDLTSQTIDPMMDSDHESHQPLSLQLSDNRRMSHYINHGESSLSFARSRPTTSTLLLSGRRLNSRNVNTDSLQMDKQPSTSLSAINLNSKSMLRISKPSLPPSSPNRTVVPNTLSHERHLGAEQRNIPISSGQMETSKEQLYSKRFQNTNSMDKPFSDENSNKIFKDAARDRLFLNSKSRVCQPTGLQSLQQNPNEILDKHQSCNKNSWSVDQIIDNKNFSINYPTSTSVISSTKTVNNVVSSQPELMNKNQTLYNIGTSETFADRQIGHTSSINTHILSSCDGIHSNEANSVNNLNMSKGTLTITSSLKPVQSPAASPFANLTSTSSSSPDQSSVQISNRSDKPFPNPGHSISMRTFTDNLNFSPKKDSFVEEPNPSHRRQSYLTTMRHSRQLNQSPDDHSSPQSLTNLNFRRVCTPSIYSYLRESNTSKTMHTSPLTSSSPQNLSTIQDKSQNQVDTRAENLKFSFDFSPVERDFSNHDCATNGPQSLPPDTGRKPLSRLSQSPYSTLISKRQKLSETMNSPSSPLESPRHIRSASFDGFVKSANTPKTERTFYLSKASEQILQNKTDGSVCSDSNQIIANTCLAASVSVNSSSGNLDSSSEKLLFGRCPSAQTSNLNKDKIFIKSIPSKMHGGCVSSPHDKGEVCEKDMLLSKDFSLPSAEKVNRSVQNGSTTLQTNNVLHSLSLQTMNVNDLTVEKNNLAVESVDISTFKPSDRVEQISHQSSVNNYPSKVGSFRLKDQIKKRAAESVASLTVSPTSTSQKTPVVGFPEATQSKQNSDVIFPNEEISCRVSSPIQNDKAKTYNSDNVNSKKLSLTPSVATISEDVQGEAVLQTPETVKSVPSSNLKSLFSLLRKRDDVMAEASTEGKEDLTLKKKESTGFRTTKMLNRLKLRFGVKLNEDDDSGISKKVKSECLDSKEAKSTGKECPAFIESPDSQMTLVSESSNSRVIAGQDMKLNDKKKQIVDNVSDTNWPKSKSAKREDVGSPNLRSPTLSNSQLPFMMEPNDSISSVSDPKLDKENILPTVDSRNSFVNTYLNPKWSKSESTKKVKETSPILKSPSSPITSVNESELGLKSSGPEHFLHMDEHKRFDSNKTQSLGRPLSPNRPDRYATLPHCRSRSKSSLSPSPTPHSFELVSEDVQNDNVFYSPKLRRHTFLDDTDDIFNTDKSVTGKSQNSLGPQYSSCADLMYGVKRSRSVSVSSVVSGRPSGPGRISTGSKQGSVSDLSSLDGFGTRSRHSSINSPFESPEHGALTSNSYPVQNTFRGFASEGQVKSHSNMQVSSSQWDTETDPTPPPSPPHSRRISQILTPSPTSTRSSPDGFSPRGLLPSQSYRSPLSVFDELNSDTTTDDEYYLNSDDDDEMETEL